jgi:predicted permease
MLQDIRLAVRRVLQSPVFSLCIVIILGAGVGATAAMVSVLYALAFRPIDVPNAKTLVAVSSANERGASLSTPLPAIDHLRGAHLPADGWCGYTSIIEATESGGRSMDADVAIMTSDCLKVIGLTPALGRWFESDETPLSGTGKPLIVITHRYWQRMFGGDADVLGRVVRIQNTSVTVIGVMPESFTGFSRDSDADVIIPFNAHRTVSGAIAFIGRIHDDASIETLRAQVQALWPSVLEAVLPAGPTRAQALADRRGKVERGDLGFSILRRLYATPVRAMAGLAAVLLLLVCINVGGLLVSRVAARTHEIATMRALGASASRVARQVFAEATIIAVAGSAVAVPIAYAGGKMFASLFPVGNMAWTMTTTPQINVYAGVLIGSLILAVAIAALPAWLATRSTQLIGTDRTVARASGRWAKAMLIAQVAATVVLVFACGLIVRSFNGLWSVDRGFRSEGLLSVRLTPNPGAYQDFNPVDYYPALAGRLANLPGVQSVGFARYFGTINTTLPPQPVGFVETSDNVSTGVLEYISPGFFSTAGVPLLDGRDVAWTDLPTSAPVALVSESLARALSPDGDVVGRVIRFGTTPATSRLQIVGVVGNLSLGNFRDTEVRIVYTPGVQAGQATFATAHLRTEGDPMRLAGAAVDAVAAMGREHAIRAATIDHLFYNSVVAEKMGMVVSSAAAVIALVISCAGLFALLSHSVARRTREIGIRMAVGATPVAVSSMIVRDALVLVFAGIVLGIPAAIGSTSVVRSLLFGVTTTDGLTLAVTVLLLIATGAIASLRPSVRAVRVDPATALRAD